VAEHPAVQAGRNLGKGAGIRRSDRSPLLDGTFMPPFKTPDLTERLAAARKAKEAALEKLRARPEPDPAAVAERQAALAAREAAMAEKRAARQQEIEQARAAKLEARAAAEAAAAAKKKPILSAEELRAARDARYAARKARQR
jgi:hypothetical protein